MMTPRYNILHVIIPAVVMTLASSGGTIALNRVGRSDTDHDKAIIAETTAAFQKEIRTYQEQRLVKIEDTLSKVEIVVGDLRTLVARQGATLDHVTKDKK